MLLKTAASGPWRVDAGGTSDCSGRSCVAGKVTPKTALITWRSDTAYTILARSIKVNPRMELHTASSAKPNVMVVGLPCTV